MFNSSARSKIAAVFAVHLASSTVASSAQNSTRPPGHAWTVELTVSQKLTEGQNFPYKFEITMLGFFTCHDGLPSGAEESRFVRVNGSSILYGAAREIIRSLTSRGPWDPLFIPAISFYDKETKPKQEPAPPASPS